MNQFERINDPNEQAQDDLDAMAADLRVAFPAIVQSVDLEKQTITAQIALQGRQTNETGTTFENYPLLVDVPIVWPRAGGFAITFPIAAGDECLIIFGDRCIDPWWQSGGVQKPIDNRCHDLSDGFAIITPTSQPKALKNVNSDAIEIRNDARDDYFYLDHAGNIVINHRSNVTITTGGNCNITVNGSANLAINGGTTLTTPNLKVDCPITQITGNVTIDGTLTANSGTMTVTGSTMAMQGTINASSNVVGGGISLNSHVHGGVQTGGGNTSGPQ